MQLCGLNKPLMHSSDAASYGDYDLEKNKFNHEFYGDWIKGYASDEYSKENIVLFEMLEKLTAHYTDEQRKHIVDIYVACSRYELAFWDLAWER